MCRDVTCVQHPRVVIDLQPSPYIPSDDEGVTRPTEHLFSTPEWIRRTFFPLPIPSKISPSVSPISYICRLTLLNDTRHAKFHSRKRSFAFLYPPVTNRISIHTPNIKKDFSPRVVEDLSFLRKTLFLLLLRFSLNDVENIFFVEFVDAKLRCIIKIRTDKRTVPFILNHSAETVQLIVYICSSLW